MEQQQQQTRNNSVATINHAFGLFLKFCSWSYGLLALFAGIMYVSQSIVLGSLLILLGVLMLPFARKLIGNAMNIRLAQPVAGGIGVAIFIVFIFMGNQLQAEEKLERERLAKIEREQELQDSMFIERHPFVDRDSLRAWRTSAADSATDSAQDLTAFLGQQEELHRMRIADSIAAAKKHRVDSIASALKWHTDSIAEAREARRLAREQANLYQSSSPTVNVEYDIDLPSRSKRSYRGSRKSYSSSGSSYSSGRSSYSSSGSSYSSGRSSYSSSSRSYSGGGGRRGGRRR